MKFLRSSVALSAISSIAMRGDQYARMMATSNAMGAGAPRAIANLSDVARFDVMWNQWEATRGCLYDSAVYAAAGQTVLNFFQNPGANGALVASPKTLSETNMQLAGQLPSNQMFIVESIDLHVQPNVNTSEVAADKIAVYGAGAVAAPIKDVWVIRRSGNLTLSIGNKPYVQEAPLMVFPPLAEIKVGAAASDTTTANVNQQWRVQTAEADGSLYVLDPNNLLIPPVTNFGVSLSWPEGVQAITDAARIFVRLNGTNLRKIQ